MEFEQSIQTIAVHLASSLSEAAKNSYQTFIIIMYITIFVTGVHAAREAARLFRLLLSLS